MKSKCLNVSVKKHDSVDGSATSVASQNFDDCFQSTKRGPNLTRQDNDRREVFNMFSLKKNIYPFTNLFFEMGYVQANHERVQDLVDKINRIIHQGALITSTWNNIVMIHFEGSIDKINSMHMVEYIQKLAVYSESSCVMNLVSTNGAENITFDFDKERCIQTSGLNNMSAFRSLIVGVTQAS
jgi:hypothetical protein